MKQLGARFQAYVDLIVGMLSRASSQIASLVTTFAAIPLLTPKEFGIFALASSFVAIVRTLLYSATFQYIIRTDRLNQYASECLIVSSIMGIIVTIIPLFVLIVFDPFHSHDVLYFFIVLAPSNIISVITAWQESQILREGGLRRYYGLTATSELLSAFVTVALLYSGFGLYALAFQLYIRSGIQLFGYAIIKRATFSDSVSVRRILEIANWALPQYGSMLTGLVSAYGADFIVGATLSPAATGLYRAASRITAAVSDICGQPIRVIAMTVFSRRASQGLSSTEAYARMLGLSILLPGTVLCGLALVADKAIPSLVNSNWRGIEVVVSILCIGRFFSIAGGVSTPLLVAYGRHRALLPTQLASAAVLIVGLFATAKYGVAAAAVVSSVSAAAGGIAYFVLSASTIRVSSIEFLGAVWPAIICAIVPNLFADIALNIASSHFSPLFSVCCAISVAVLVFALCLYLLGSRISAIVEVVRHSN